MEGEEVHDVAGVHPGADEGDVGSLGFTINFLGESSVAIAASTLGNQHSSIDSNGKSTGGPSTVEFIAQRCAPSAGASCAQSLAGSWRQQEAPLG